MRSALWAIGFGLVCGACGGGGDGLGGMRDFSLFMADDMAVAPDLAGSAQAQHVVSKLTLPANGSSHAFDLDGDGTTENRLGAIMSALAALGMNPQGNADAAVAGGQLVLLIDETSSDPTQQSALAASARLFIGQPGAAPKFNGTDTFTVNSSMSPGEFSGAISGGTFTSEPTATATTPVSMTLLLPIVPGMSPLALPITAAHLTFTRSASGAITSGQLNGAIRKTDVDTLVLPAIADLLTAQLPDPTIAMFDTNSDGKITSTELKGNALIGNFLAPDVQLFQGGVYDPNPAKTVKDSLSLGIGLQGVKASF